VKFVHPEYGVFVRLEPGVKVAIGDLLEAVRDGKVVSVLTVKKLSRPEPVYPHGAAVCTASTSEAAEGHAVRRAKP
jgi:hypothetical protein